MPAPPAIISKARNAWRNALGRLGRGGACSMIAGRRPSPSAGSPPRSAATSRLSLTFVERLSCSDIRTLARTAVGSNVADLAAYQGIAASMIVAEADPIGGFRRRECLGAPTVKSHSGLGARLQLIHI